MENASKALIIAGAILLAILIISLGMMVLSNATGLLKNGGMDKAGVQAFNETFLKYDGNKKGSEIRSLVSEVMSNNNSDEASDETRVSINGDGNGPVTLGAGEDEQPHYADSFKNTQTYKVSFDYTKGRVSNIKVEAVSK